MVEPPTPPPVCSGQGQYLSWVWQFTRDGPPESIAPILASNGLGITLKAFDGTDWMSVYDSSPQAVSGPNQVAALAQYFEGQGVPFHAWAVIKGLDPIREAQMAAEVLGAGARSLYIDLEPWAGFWQGTAEAARAFGQELRRLQPNAVVIVAIDPRPWVVPLMPLAEFASFSNALAPLIYWQSFNSQGNLDRFISSGYPPGPGGITPEFLLDVTSSVLAPYGLPLEPVGQGSTGDINLWVRFLDHASRAGMTDVSVWRYGVTDPQVWALLSARAGVPC